MRPLLQLDHVRMSYFPAVYFNDFWLLREHLVPLNETVTEVPLHFSLSSVGMLRLTLYQQAEASFSMQARLPKTMNRG